MKDLVIIGAGGHAKVVVEAALLQGVYRIVGLASDGAEPGQTLLGYPVRSSYKDFGLEQASFVIAIGDNRVRKQKFEELIEAGWTAATILHPSAVISKFCTIGRGTVICLRASLCTESQVGENVIINSAASIAHECVVGDHSHVSAGVDLAGQTKIGQGCLIGISSCTVPRVKIGDWSIVGAGAAVIKDLEPGSKVGGVPAKPLRTSISKSP